MNAFTATLTNKQIAQAMTAISASYTADQVTIFGALEDELTSRNNDLIEKFDEVYGQGLRGGDLLRALAAEATSHVSK